MTNEELLEIAYTRELTDERVATAAAYWLDASRHERIEADGVILARYARKAMQEIEQLKADKAALLKSANDVLNVQGLNGNWNYDAYMHGMFNGMELIVSIMESREPNYREAPTEWLCDREVALEDPVVTEGGNTNE